MREIFKNKKRPVWKLGTSLIVASALFPFPSRIIMWRMGIEVTDKASDYSGSFMAAFIIGMAILYGVTYIISYFLVHLVEQFTRLFLAK